MNVNKSANYLWPILWYYIIFDTNEGLDNPGRVGSGFLWRTSRGQLEKAAAAASWLCNFMLSLNEKHVKIITFPLTLLCLARVFWWNLTPGQDRTPYYSSWRLCRWNKNKVFCSDSLLVGVEAIWLLHKKDSALFWTSWSIPLPFMDFLRRRGKLLHSEERWSLSVWLSSLMKHKRKW